MTNPLTSLAKTATAAAATANPALAKAAHAFEAVFLRQMIGSMRSAKLGDALFGSSASDQFRDMSDAKLADDMAGRFGIAAMLEKQFAGKAAPVVPAAAPVAAPPAGDVR